MDNNVSGDHHVGRYGGLLIVGAGVRVLLIITQACPTACVRDGMELKIRFKYAEAVPKTMVKSPHPGSRLIS